ncbi:MAG: DUF6165 family protein [Zavarzinia sp.]|nr:DUF6165 family protein [Zavarzinia sp.]
MTASLATPSVPVSWGELWDKITILELKMKHLSSAEALRNVEVELKLLGKVVADANAAAIDGLDALVDELRAVNGQLWVIEDDIREEERKKDFGEKFVSLARSVYFRNDERAAVKRRINKLLASEIVEEKSYAAY